VNVGDSLDDNDKILLHEKNRLKYYYAVVECDSVETANSIYDSCDQLELGISGNLLDCRYIPDDFQLPEKPRDAVTHLPPNYTQPDFETKSMKSTNVEMSWDEKKTERKKLVKKNKEELLYDEDVKSYLASSSSEDEGLDELTKKELRKKKGGQASRALPGFAETV